MGEGYNRLIHEKSPYLLQHASNPVDWYPWGEEAFEKADKEDKPIFLSIGYSTCHWCHVMEEESFSDSEVARLMNEVFVAVKVDREERPDLDNHYMSVCQLLTGSGGWPLTIVMTPDKIPFFAGTYFPKESRFGRIGMLDLVPLIKEIWTERRGEVIITADKALAAILSVSKHSAGRELDKGNLEAAYEELAGTFDEKHGGFGKAPKFPTPHNIYFLLRYWRRTKEDKALRMVEKTLQAMRRGGIFDQIGFGFHRYSTDREWLVPHFEKMLYDQALLAMAYTEAFQATEKEEYGRVAKEIFIYILRDMTAPEGGFYSGEDADSEGEEGKFYIWAEEEVMNVLGGVDSELTIKVFNIKEEGNFRPEGGKGANILHMTASLDEVASEMKISKMEIEKRVAKIRRKLLAAREKRIRPHRDDKILADWNGLVIAALAKASRVFDESRYAEAAERAMEFILQNMRSSNGTLLHRYREGESAISGYVDDYAFMVWGLLELYETTFDASYLRAALELNEITLKHLWDDVEGGFYFTPDDYDDLPVRRKEANDGAVPSGNSVAMMNLLRLSHFTGNSVLEEYATRIGRAFSRTTKRSPASFTQMMAALEFALGPSYEVVIAGDPEVEDTREMLRALGTGFLPNMVVLLNPQGQATPEIHGISSFVKDYEPINDKSTAYVCTNYSCKQPTTDVGEMLRSLGV